MPEPQARPETPRGFYLAMAELMRRVEHSRQGNTDLTASELRVTSQNGEDGVIAELLRRIGTSPDPYFVEFGVEDGSEGNCVFLADALGWSGLFLELDPDQYAPLGGQVPMVDWRQYRCRESGTGDRRVALLPKRRAARAGRAIDRRGWS